MSIKHSNASAWEKNTRTTTKAILLGFTCLQWPDCGPKIGSKFYCCFVPRAGSCTAANSVLFNHLVCTTEQRKRKRDARAPKLGRYRWRTTMAQHPNRIVDPCYRAEDLQPAQKARRRRRHW